MGGKWIVVGLTVVAMAMAFAVVAPGAGAAIVVSHTGGVGGTTTLTGNDDNDYSWSPMAPASGPARPSTWPAT